ncbi:MBL fold metallo-hydrolase [Mesorhizobium sp. CAU 1741]|uniref:MBL fold metallo-hydrolase n=1 Tax=Mesorhizobium sp. CAU 1741 TaxID=3140366 RepID=UPI00325BC40D
MSQGEFRKGVEDLGNGLYAYIQPDGSWGWSNSGLITDGDASLLVDTLFTLDLTREMLAAFRDVTPAARHVNTLVNTHSNGDHTFGNQLVEGARIIASTACKEEMYERPPEEFRANMERWREQGEAGKFLHEVMGAHFDFSGIVLTPPDITFSGRHDVTVGGTAVELHEFGPAHTRGDIVAYVPSARTVFTGDLLFAEGHPILWAGPVGNWIDACEAILGWDVDIVVPGHGPVGDKRAVRAMRDYLVHTRDEAKTRYEAGMTYADAAWDIAFDAYDSWIDRERVVVNVAQIYRELSGGTIVPERAELMKLMGRYRAGAKSPHEAPVCNCGHSH